jgi:hypothetical protein
MTDTYKERATMAETIIATTDLEYLKLTSWTDLENYGEEFCKAFNAGVSACIAVRPASGWLPIESAPKDGRDLWLYVPKEEPPQVVGYWIGDEPMPFWQYREALVADVAGWIDSPTHWMPLPAPPLPPSPESKP